MENQNRNFNRILVVRISESQYLKLLEAIIAENKIGVKTKMTPIDKSKIIRNFIENYGKLVPNIS
jgi:hypothetical protein